MRLNSHSSESSSLGGGGGGGEGRTTESNDQNDSHHRLGISNSNNAIAHEITNDHYPQQHFSSDDTANLTKSNITGNNATTPPPFNTTNINHSDSPIRNPFHFEHSSQDLHHQTPHHHNNRHNHNSKAQLPTGTNTDDDEEERNPETNNTSDNNSYHSSSAILAAHHHHHGDTAYNYAAAAGANQLLNRYCLEQTIRHLHEFQDVRNLSSTPGGASMSGPATSLSTNLANHQTT